MFFKKNVYICIRKRGISSVGRALGSQSRGQGFDPPILHKKGWHLCQPFLRSMVFLNAGTILAGKAHRRILRYGMKIKTNE